MIPPMMMRVRVDRAGRRRLGCWLPLFLLWPILLILFVLLLPFLLVVCLFPRWGRRMRTTFRGLPVLWKAVCALRGLTVDVSGRDGNAVKVWAK